MHARTMKAMQRYAACLRAHAGLQSLELALWLLKPLKEHHVPDYTRLAAQLLGSVPHGCWELSISQHLLLGLRRSDLHTKTLLRLSLQLWLVPDNLALTFTQLQYLADFHSLRELHIQVSSSTSVVQACAYTHGQHTTGSVACKLVEELRLQLVVWASFMKVLS